MKIQVESKSTVIEVLLKYFGSASRTKIKKIIVNGSITINDKIVRKSDVIVNIGDVIIYRKFIENSAKKVKCVFKVLFEDDFLIAINKPAGILMHGETGINNTTVQKAMNSYIKENSKSKKQAYLIHRLDREVTGIVLIAKEYGIMQKMKEHWYETEKLYFALLQGKPKHEEGEISSWIVEDFKQKVKSVPEGTLNAKHAITRYKVIKYYDKYTLVEINLKTGRKNQIRLHFSEMGCPVVGDRRYGADDKYESQIRLIAYSLSFKHPVNDKIVHLKLPLPSYFLDIQNENEKYK